jgi:hypothetical protein
VRVDCNFISRRSGLPRGVRGDESCMMEDYHLVVVDDDDDNDDYKNGSGGE